MMVLSPPGYWFDDPRAGIGSIPHVVMQLGYLGTREGANGNARYAMFRGGSSLALKEWRQSTRMFHNVMCENIRFRYGHRAIRAIC